jgi:hypothetical protein
MVYKYTARWTDTGVDVWVLKAPTCKTQKFRSSKMQRPGNLHIAMKTLGLQISALCFG